MITLLVFLSTIATIRAQRQDVHTPSEACQVSVVADGQRLTCYAAYGVSFHDILPEMQKLGDGLVEVMVYLFEHNPTPVELNQTCFSKNPNLKRIIRMSCGITRIALGTFQHLTNLTFLSLMLNKIAAVSKHMFQGPSMLLYLFLGGNDIRHIPKDLFDYIQRVTELELSGNPIVNVAEGALSGLKNLTYLNLGSQQDSLGNNLFIPPINLLKGLKQLEQCHLECVAINSMIFGGEETMTEFFKDQEDSLISFDIPEAGFENKHLPMLKNLRRLRRLNLQQNKLGYIRVGSLPKIAKDGLIDLGDNRLLTIDGEAFKGYDSRLGLHLDGNAFYCDCQILQFSEWLRRYNMSAHYDYHQPLCTGPFRKYGKKVEAYEPYWWQCSPYVPLIALVAVVGLAILIAIIAVIVACNRVNYKHFRLERRAMAEAEAEAEEQTATPSESRPLVPSAYNSLPKGLTEAYVLYDMNEVDVKQWVDQHIEEKLYNHPMKVRIQWAAGADFIPLWKQVKEYGFGVKHFLVVVTENIIQNHWSLMSENSGVENLSKCVLVLWGVTKKDLPKDLRRLNCPSVAWPMSKPALTSLQREREQFWKHVRILVKDISD